MELSALIEKLFIFLVLMIIGYVLARRGTLSRDFTKTASSLTINVFMCATILQSAMSLEAAISLAELGRLVLVVTVMQFVGFIVAAVVARAVPGDAEHAPVFELLMAIGNSMFIALPIVQGMFGAVAVFYVALSCIPFNVMLYTYGVLRLKSGRGDRTLHVRDIFSTPLIAALLSLLIIFFQIPLPGVVRSLVNAMSGATMPLSMLVIGASLGSVSLLDAFRSGRFYLISAVRLLVIPLLTWLVVRMITSDPVLLMTMVIIAACPCAVVVTVLAVQYDRDAVYTAEATLQSTALSMLTIPLMVWLISQF